MKLIYVLIPGIYEIVRSKMTHIRKLIISLLMNYNLTTIYTREFKRISHPYVGILLS